MGEAAALVPVLVLLGTGVAVGILGAGAAPLDERGCESSRRRAAGLAWIGVIGAAAACLRLHGHRMSAFGWVESDSHSRFLSLVVLAGIALALPVVSALGRQHELDEGRWWKLHVHLLLSSAGMLLMVSTRNLVVILIALELVSIGVFTFSQTARAGQRKMLLRAWSKHRLGRYYSSGTGLATAPALLGVALLCYELGGCDLAGMEIALVARGEAMGLLLPLIGAGFFLLGLGWRVVALVVLSAHSRRGASANATEFLAVAVQVSVFGVLLRMTGWLLVLAEHWKVMLLVLAIVAMSMGCLIAVTQAEMKRMLAFTNLVHIGTLFLGVAVGGGLGRSSVAFYLLAYSLSILGAFTVAHALGGEAEQHRFIRDFRGLGWKHPLLGLTMSLFMLSLAGMPLTIGFVGKFYLFSVALREGYLAPALIGLLTAAVSATCYLRVLVSLYMEAPPISDRKMPLPSRSVGLSLLVTFCVVALAGFFPDPWLSLAKRFALEFF